MEQRKQLPTARQLQKDQEKRPPAWPVNYSFYLFGPRNVIRRRCARFLTNPWFDRCTMILIVLCSVALALDSPRNDPASSLAICLRYSDVAFTAAFAVECAVKMTAFTFWNGPQAYMLSGPNVLDLFVVITSVLGIVGDGIPGVAPLRLLRVLRPLRLMNQHGGMRIIISSLVDSLPAVSPHRGVQTKQAAF